jgi:hypothetical protein
MSECPASTQFTLPIALAGKAFKEDRLKAAQSLCVPYDQARPGDLIALAVDWRQENSGVIMEPITRVLTISEEAPHEPKTSPVAKLPEDVQIRLSHPCMMLQCEGFNSDYVGRLSDKLDPYSNDGFSFNFLITSDLPIMMIDDPVGDVFEGRYFGEEHEQSHIDEAFSALIPGDKISNHQALNISQRIQVAVDLVNDYISLTDDDGQRIHLGKPDLQGLVKS